MVMGAYKVLYSNSSKSQWETLAGQLFTQALTFKSSIVMMYALYSYLVLSLHMYYMYSICVDLKEDSWEKYK